MIMDHFCPPSLLHGTLILVCSNLTESDEAAQKRKCRDKYGPNLSYFGPVKNTGTLYATLDIDI